MYLYREGERRGGRNGGRERERYGSVSPRNTTLSGGVGTVNSYIKAFLSPHQKIFLTGWGKHCYGEEGGREQGKWRR